MKWKKEAPSEKQLKHLDIQSYNYGFKNLKEAKMYFFCSDEKLTKDTANELLDLLKQNQSFSYKRKKKSIKGRGK